MNCALIVRVLSVYCAYIVRKIQEKCNVYDKIKKSPLMHRKHKWRLRL